MHFITVYGVTANMGETGIQVYFDNYSPIGDITVMATCIFIVALVFTSYVKKSKSFKIFLNLIVYLFLAAATNVFYHKMYTGITDGNYRWVYILRCAFHAFLFSNLLLYIVYIVELQRLELAKKVPVMIISVILYFSAIAVDIFTTVSGKGFKLTKNGRAVNGVNVFFWGYISFIIIIVFLMLVNRKRLYKQVMLGFYATMVISFVLLFIQGIVGNNSYTVVSFMFPVLAMLYLVHSNPYDIELGAIDAKALEDLVSYNYEKKRSMIFFSLYLPDFDEEGKQFTKEMQTAIRRFASEYFKAGVLFQVSSGHVILMAEKRRNPDYENRVNKIINAFNVEKEKFGYDFKIVLGETVDEVSRRKEYVSFIRIIQDHIDMNTIHMVEYEDIERFNNYEYVLSELEDIYRKKDLRDTRVMAYCQPVYNIRTKKYDTAEALMRLKLPDMGMVFPDKFIGLAEANGYIHVLTQIILQKTCDEIKNLLKKGYDFKRISVNVSVLEMRDEKFTSDIEQIIEASGIPEEKVAIELTESQSESDFELMKDIIDSLKGKGVKFYLDDFGTGFSNMERIMGLPFDIIKFDRSLVIASDSDERAEKMVSSLANMFAELDYSVLYEGVENESDEERCIRMSASYLQGYKYSKPIPMIELSRFFSKKE